MKRFLLSLLLTGIAVLAPVYAVCPPDRIDAEAFVKYVHDGDTLILADKSKLRIIGIDTPELARDNKPAEALAIEARNFVRRLLKQNGKTLKLRYDAESRDQYQRRLAHVFIADNRNLSEILLQNGLATLLMIPPNLWHLECYAAAEKQARLQNKGLWALPQYQAVNVAALEPEHAGIRLVYGRVDKISRENKADFIYLVSEHSRGETRLRIKIDAEDRRYFSGKLLESLQGATIEARGRLHAQQHRGEWRYYMRIRHPGALYTQSH